MVEKATTTKTKKKLKKEDWFRIDAGEFTTDWLIATMTKPMPMLKDFAEAQYKKHKNKTYEDYPLEDGELSEDAWSNVGKEFTEEKCKTKMYSLNKQYKKAGDNTLKYLPTGKKKGIAKKNWSSILKAAMEAAGAEKHHLKTSGSLGD